MKREREQLSEQIHKILWHMRGGLSREEAWTLSMQEREQIISDIKERVENVEKTGLPVI